MPRVELEAIAQTNRSGYPAPFDQAVQRHWRDEEDEMPG